MSAEMFVKVFIAVFAFLVFIIVFFTLNITTLTKIEKGKKSKKKGKELYLTEAQYLYFKYKINKKRLYNRKFAIIFALINSAIISITIFVIEMLPMRMEFGLVIGFVFLIGFIYSVYGIMGSILVKKGYQDEL